MEIQASRDIGANHPYLFAASLCVPKTSSELMP